MSSRPKIYLEFKTKKRRKVNVSSSRPKNYLEYETKKSILSSRPKKKKRERLEFETKKKRNKGKKGKTLSSRLKITKKFRSKKGFLSNIAGNEIPKIGGYVYYIPELWKIISEIFPGLYRVESCLSRTWKVTTLEDRAPANIRSHALHTEVQLQNQCMQLEKLKSTNASLTKDLVELRQELDNYCNKTKKATKEDLVKCNAECEAL